MKAAIIIEVDDEKLEQHIDRAHSEYAADGGTDERMAAEAWLIDRIQSVADDELRVALWGWTTSMDMTVHVAHGQQLDGIVAT